MSNGKIGGIALCGITHRAFGSFRLGHHLGVELLAVVGHYLVHLALFHLAQHVVEIHVESLQVDVGSNKAGELVIVIVLIDVEQLFLIVGDNGKSILNQSIGERFWHIRHLHGVGQIVEVGRPSWLAPSA